ncbi:something about silencing protein 10-like isoform X2 [Montipora capricornis]|uniref:something about silencing protein 10-like isoform X2 n=1 Tax=Montipora capricornis TaxID=246305 RepID=UPI0035F2015D
MARSKRRRKPRKLKEEEKEPVYEEPDPNSDDFFYDDVDKFHAEREKILLDSASDPKDGELSSDENNHQDEEVLALDVDDSSDNDEDDGGGSDHENEEFEEEEDEEEEVRENGKDGGDIPSVKSWGRRKSAFYDGDIDEEYAGSDEEMDELAEEEEEEALALQKQMAASLEEQDFDADVFELPQISKKEEGEGDFNKETIVQDLSKLSSEEKIQILIKESPELFQLMDEFKLKLKEVTERLHPLVKMARAGQISEEGASYIELKHQLYLNYCINIGYYLLLKAKNVSVKDHPVMGRLVQYQKLITELKPLDEKLKSEEELLLLQGQTPEQGLQKEAPLQSVKTKRTSKKLAKPGKLSSLLDDEGDIGDEESILTVENLVKAVRDKEARVHGKKREKNGKRKAEGDPVQMDPLEYYEAVKLAKKKKKEVNKAASRATEEQSDMDEKDTMEGKRGITYQISQNKGLTVKKKKEDRNPRVKLRKKYRKAQIKRKSQVLPVLNEQYRYGGEATGIKSNLTRSIKIR